MTRVLICDDDAELGEIMAELLQEVGAECVVTRSLAEIKSRATEVLSCGVAILDVNLGNGHPSGVEVYEWLRSEGFRGKIAFLTGHAIASPILRELRSTGVHVLSKPIPSEVLIDLAASGAAP